MPRARVTFSAYEGEVLGLVGLRGAGQEAVARALFGAEASSGAVHLDGKPLDMTSPEIALRQGVGLIARDRTEESVAPALSIRENMFLNPLAIGRTLMSILSPSAEAAQVTRHRRRSGLAPQ